MELKERLVALQELFSNPNHWTTGYVARTATNAATFPDSADAVSWCIYGGCHKVCGAGDNGPTRAYNEAIEMSDYLDTHVGKIIDNAGSSIWLNDNHGYEAVMRLIKVAIENAPSDQGS